MPPTRNDPSPGDAVAESCFEQPWAIINPAAAQGAGMERLRALFRHPRLLGADAELKVSLRPGGVGALALEAAASGASLVLAVGGDGTFREVVAALMNLEDSRRPPVSILPAGTGNDFAKMLGIPVGADNALNAIRAGEVRAIDVGRAGDRWFVNECAAGLIARATRAYHRLPRWARGAPRYVMAALQAIATHRNGAARIFVEDSLFFEGPTAFAAVSNGAWSGGRFTLNPGARIDDGRFDLCMARALSRFEALRSLPRLVRGDHASHPLVQTGLGTRFRIEAPDWDVFELDGELFPFPGDGLEISVEPGAIRALFGAGAPH